MSRYTILVSKNAKKELDKLDNRTFNLISQKILELSEDPRPNGFKKLKGREGYRVRTGVYRIIYTIVDKELVIEIIAIGHRKDIYD